MVRPATRPAPAANSAAFPGFSEDAPLDLPPLGAEVAAGLVSRFRDGTMDDFADALAGVHYCTRPVRLHGHSTTIDCATGEVLSTFRSTDAPLGVLHRPCGNRRAHVCPACSRIYARDTFALIRSGIAGGKTVPEEVADNPLLFVTLTAPSFGPVHGTRPNNGRCHPRARAGRCPHGRPRSCMARHDEDDPLLGAPLCQDCDDSASAVVWQWHAPELWRRLTINLRRGLAHELHVSERKLGDVASVQYAKVAEYQARGLVHFHALIRLDGPAKDGIGAPAPEQLDGKLLARLVHHAARDVAVTAEPVDDHDSPRVLHFGRQVDVRVVRPGRRTDDPAGPLTGEQVAGYLAKYATKDATSIAGDDARHRPHLARLRRVCAEMAERAARHHPEGHHYQRMAKWVHCLGFRGHFSTKSRRYSITLGALRRARARWQALAAESRRTGDPIDTADLEQRLLADEQEETTLVVGSWTYLGTGWRDAAEEALALASAGRAREYARWRAAERTEGEPDRAEGAR